MNFAELNKVLAIKKTEKKETLPNPGKIFNSSYITSDYIEAYFLGQPIKLLDSIEKFEDRMHVGLELPETDLVSIITEHI